MKRFNFLLGMLFILSSQLLVHAELPKGELTVMIFANGKAIANRGIRAGEQLKFSDKEGWVQFQLPMGSHRLTLDGQPADQGVEVFVEPGSTTEVIVNLLVNEIDFQVAEPNKLKIRNNTLSDQKNSKKIAGLVKDDTTNLPIKGAKIFVKGLGVIAETDTKGIFQASVPEGKTVLSIFHEKYTTRVVPETDLSSKENWSFSLIPTGIQLEEYVVLAPKSSSSIAALIEVRRKSRDIADVISAEQMSKSGDSSAASSLRRVTGVTLVDGKFVYVRGLGERYSNTVLNGVSISSPDPARKVVPLDLFPTGVLNSIIVQKSYSPERTAEFAGGSVMLQTKAFAKKNQTKVSVSPPIDRSFLDDFKSYPGGSHDWLGTDDGTRALPSGVDDLNNQSALQSFKNTHNLTPAKPARIPNISLSSNASFGPKNWRLSLLGSGLYGNSYDYAEVKTKKVTNDDTGEISTESSFVQDKYKRTIKTGLIGGLALKVHKKHTLKADYLLVRRTTDVAAEKRGNDFDLDRNVRNTELIWTERELKTFILTGSHEVNPWQKWKLDWHYSSSRANLDEPDAKSYQYGQDVDGRFRFLGSTNQSSYQRRYTKMKEKTRDFGGKVNMEFPWYTNQKSELYFGLNRVDKQRAYRVKRYTLQYSEGGLEEQGIDDSQDLDYILSNCLKPECFQYSESTRQTDTYDARQKIDAYFTGVKIPVFDQLILNSGMRIESSEQYVDSFELFSATPKPAITRLYTKDTLPVHSLLWKLNEEMQIRTSYSETVSRPDLRELSKTLWHDDELDIDVQGNPELKSATIRNYDLRYEWYFGSFENISLGGFYKRFYQPIETVIIGASDEVVGFANASGADNYGAEFEFRKNAGFVHEWLEPFTLYGNYSRIESKIRLDKLTNIVLTNKERPLQGQSPYVINIGLDVEFNKKRSNFNLVYNEFGPRIFQVGIETIPDTIEQPFEQLNAVYSHKFGKNFSLKLKADNLLASKKIYTKENLVVREVDVGLSGSMSLSAVF